MYLTELNHCIDSYYYRLGDYYGMCTYEDAIGYYPFAYFVKTEWKKTLEIVKSIQDNKKLELYSEFEIVKAYCWIDQLK